MKPGKPRRYNPWKELKRQEERPLQRRDRRIALLIATGLLLLILGYGAASGTLAKLFRGSGGTDAGRLATDSATILAQREYEAFVASLDSSAERSSKWAWRTTDGTYRRKGNGRESRAPAELFPFDPNTVDSATLRRLGMPAWMAGNVVKYRSKGGKFRRAEDFRRIYGMTDEYYTALEPFIRIDSLALVAQAPQLLRAEKEGAHLNNNVSYDTGAGDYAYRGGTAISAHGDFAGDSASHTGTTGDATHTLGPADAHSPAPADYPTKYPAGTLVDLNRADTTELRRIPDIGPAIARAIVTYRERLGGYYRIGQLHEITFSQGRRLDTTLFAPWFTIDPTAIRPINLNHASLERLRRHPYINFYQAKAIVEARRRDGRITSLRIFALLDEFTADDLARLAPYVCFGDSDTSGR